jgi:hypothetical protein
MYLLEALIENNISPVLTSRKESVTTTGIATVDLIIIARKNAELNTP